MAITHQGITSATIESGRVLDVNINNYTLAVATQYSKKPLTGVTWSTPYMHFVNGEGMYIMPEVGSLCWICFPSDGSRAFVLGWRPAGDEGDYRSRRQNLNPGDIFMGTRDENFLYLRRGGVVEIGANHLSNRLYIPLGNIIRDFCETYELHTLGGDLVWTIQRSQNTTDGSRPALLTITGREFSDDPNPIATIRVGSHGGGDSSILSVLINSDGQAGANQEIKLSLSKDGNVSWTVAKDVSYDVTGKYKVSAKDSVSIESTTADLSLKAQTTVLLEGQTGVTIKADTGIVQIIGAPLIKMGSIVNVGTAPQPVALATPLLTWLAAHVHSITTPVPGSPTTPPTIPPPIPLITSTTLLASQS